MHIVPDDDLTVGEVLRLVAQPVPNPVPNFVVADVAKKAAELGRSTGMRLLGAIDAPKSKKVSALIDALVDPSHRVAVIEMLGKFGPDAKPALPALMKLKLDSVAAVREAATKAVEAINAE